VQSAIAAIQAILTVLFIAAMWIILPFLAIFLLLGGAVFILFVAFKSHKEYNDNQ
jgi:flagellar basal body-associated protein FliL